MSSREAGQSQASADALDAYMAKAHAAADARIKVRGLNRELRLAREAVRVAESEELAALRAYEATPFSNEKVTA